MITSTTYTSDSRHRTEVGTGFDGVVRISFGGYYGTGTLLFDGRAILTSGHLFQQRNGTANVLFEISGGSQTVSASKFVTHPAYDTDANNDLAIVFLSGTVPISANRYNLYRNSDEIGQLVTLVGYGKIGTGSTGSTDAESSVPTRLKAFNQFDAEIATLKNALGTQMAWSPLPGSQLIADFDSGSTANDALGMLINRPDKGRGLDEGMIAQGDSGGPAFIDGRLAGVANYTTSLSKNANHPDIDDNTNSSFGEIGAWQRVSHYQQWIDQTLRENYPNAPIRPEEVKKEINEGNSGTVYSYFLVKFTGTRTSAQEIVSVDYRTQDGTAKAGEDYIAVSGTLNLYPNENQAVIPVEVIGDTIPEPTENLYLEVFNPKGGSFGEGIVKLTAVRTILDDDGWIGSV